jgi:hypothetical protein
MNSKSKKLFIAIGEVNDNKIAISEGHLTQTKSTKRIKLSSRQLVSVAAAIALVVGAVFVFYLMKPEETFLLFPPDTSETQTEQANPPVISSELPKLDIVFEFGTMGFEAYMAYDISELGNGNPWTIQSTIDNELTTLPVFRNTNVRNYMGEYANPLSAEEMIEKAENAALALGVEPIEIYTSPTQEEIAIIMEKFNATGGASEEDIRINTQVQHAVAKLHDDSHIVVWGNENIALYLTSETKHLVKEIGRLLEITDNFTVWLQFGMASDYNEFDGEFGYDKGLPIPQRYSFSHYNTTAAQAQEVTQYLLTEYGAFAGITTPGFNSFGNYDIYGRLIRLWYSVFENKESLSLTERILNWNFNKISFSPNSIGELGAIRFERANLSDLIGYYPIITAQEAQEMLLNKQYITTVPYEFIDTESIAHVELVYRNSESEDVFVPYYRFFVEHSVEGMGRPEGMKGFGAYYVPAIHSDFLENAPIWNSSFN